MNALVSVYQEPEAASLLYRLLEERTPEINISHKAMPTWEEHRAFVASEPYLAWYVIQVDGELVGGAYLTKLREIGVFVLQAHRGKGYGKWAVHRLMEMHPGNFLANVNPSNHGSISFFRAFGFRLLQMTFACPSTDQGDGHVEQAEVSHASRST